MGRMEATIVLLVLAVTMILLLLEVRRAKALREEREVWREQAKVAEALRECWQVQAEDWRGTARMMGEHSQALVDRMLRMQREGFIEIPFPSMAEEPEDEGGDTSGPEEAPYRTVEQLRAIEEGYARGNPGMSAWPS